MWNKSANGAKTVSKNCISEKMVVCKLQAKMLLSNQITEFFDCRYLRKEAIIIMEFSIEILTKKE